MIVGVSTALFAVVSAFAVPKIDAVLASQISMANISALFLAIGAAMIGATALAFTLVMFAMQVNVQRLPHGLFKRFSTDIQLLSYFVAMFTIALSVTLGSLFVSTFTAGIAIVFILWACLLIIVILWITYRRALLLISPWEQLQLMVATTARHLRRSVRRADILRPSMEPLSNGNGDTQSLHQYESNSDLARNDIFRLDPNWDAEAYRSVSFAVSFSKRFAEFGDYETSWAALRSIVEINKCYIDARGKTFVGSYPYAAITGQPGGGDPFISATLEHLRQYMQVAMGRSDERQIGQIFSTFAALTRDYLGIEYAVAGDSKHYAALGAGYLTAAVKAVPSLKSPDMLMIGVRMIGDTCRNLLAAGVKSDVVTMSEALCELAASSLLEPQLRLVIDTIMMEYADTLVALLISDEYEVRFEAGELQKRVVSVASMLLVIPESSISREHSMYVKSFYSTGHASSLCVKLGEVEQYVFEANADDAKAVRIVRHIQDWACDLWKHHRELLQRAVEKRSMLAFDLIHWISQVSQQLIVIADAPATSANTAENLRQSASWLALTLSWVPSDDNSIELAERFGLTDQFFSMALIAQTHKAPDISKKIQHAMLDRACTTAAEKAGSQILSKTIRGICVLAVMSGVSDAVAKLVERLKNKLLETDAPSQEYREQAAMRLVEYDFGFTQIDYAMGQVDQQQLQEALNACAAALRGVDEASAESSL